jgi:sarcosine oxidase, subunit gamma
MSEARSALPGAVHGGRVRVEEAGLLGMVTLRGDLAAPKLKRAVAAAVGAEVPPVRRMTGTAGRGSLWMSPDELLLLMPHGEAGGVAAGLAQALAGEHHLAAEVSDARAVFRLTGELSAIREVLAKLTPADVSPEGLSLGEVRRTRLGQVAAALVLDEGGATVLCFRSVAAYVFDLLSNAAAPDAAVGYWA